MFLSLPPANEMFQFTGFPPLILCVQIRVTEHDLCRVSPFGYPRVKACFRLTVAFRRLLRPSSATVAKASSLRSFLLDRWMSIPSVIVVFSTRFFILTVRIPTDSFLQVNLFSRIVQLSRYR